jgi:hypothetical protein
VIVPAVEAADEIAAVLGSWALELVERRGGPGPSWAGWWWSSTSTRVDRDTGEAYLARGVPQGLRPGWEVTGIEALVRWMIPHMSWLVEQEWAPVMRSEIGDLLARVRARFPVDERVRPVTEVLCPECDRQSLEVHPPAYFGAPVQVVCSHSECGAWLDEHEWDQRLRASVVAAAVSRRDQSREQRAEARRRLVARAVRDA